MISDLSDVGAEMITTAQDVKKVSDDLFIAMTTNRQSVHQTSSALEEITSIVSGASDNAEKALGVTNSTSESASKGVKVVQVMLSSIEVIRQSTESLIGQMNETNIKIEEIEHLFSEVVKKTNVINDIVFQTKLLSFNASVEAARAGEHGKGFAVVAEEIGKLAEISGSSSKDISEIMTKGSATINKIIKETKTSLDKLAATAYEKVKMGISSAESCSQSFSSINELLKEVNNSMSGLARSSKEQSAGIAEVNSALLAINLATEEGARLAENTKEISEQVSNQSEGFKNIVAEMEIMFTGTMKS